MSNMILSEENAEEQFNLLLEYYDIDEPEDDDLKKAFGMAKRKLIKAIRKGRLEIKEENGLKVYQNLSQKYTQMESPIVYGEVCGKAKIAMREASDNDNYGKIYALLGGLTGNGSGQIKVLKGIDLAIAENLGSVFLMV